MWPSFLAAATRPSRREDHTVRVDENGIVEAERPDALGDLVDLPARGRPGGLGFERTTTFRSPSGRGPRELFCAEPFHS